MRLRKPVFLFLFTLLFLLNSFIGTSIITLQDAINEQKISVEILSLGSHEGDCISLNITNHTRRPFKMQVGRGTLFTPADDGDQNIVVAVSQVLALNGSAAQQFEVEGYCTEAGDKCPSTGSSFGITKIDDDKLKSLLKYVTSRPKLFGNAGIIQAAIWSVTDDHGVSNIYDQDNEEVKNLRSFICNLTGQKNVWYNTKRQTRVNEQRMIVSEPVEVSGNIALICLTPLTMAGVVIKENGEEKWVFPRAIPLPKGNVKFKFKLKVQNWEPGKYYIVYTSKTDTLLKQEFSI